MHHNVNVMTTQNTHKCVLLCVGTPHPRATGLGHAHGPTPTVPSGRARCWESSWRCCSRRRCQRSTTTRRRRLATPTRAPARPPSCGRYRSACPWSNAASAGQIATSPRTIPPSRPGTTTWRTSVSTRATSPRPAPNSRRPWPSPSSTLTKTTPPSRAPASRCRPSAAASSPRPPRPGLLPGRNSRAARLSGQPAIRDQPARRASGA